MSNSSPESQPVAAEEPQDLKTRAISLIGYVLGISYPLLALSTGARGLYQLFLRDDLTKLGPALSVLTAVLYVVAAIGFFKRTARWWRISVSALTHRDGAGPRRRHAQLHHPRRHRQHRLAPLRPGLRLLPPLPAAAGLDLPAVAADAGGLRRAGA